VEPEILRRGKEFHRLVQAAWAGEIERAPVHSEHIITAAVLEKGVTRHRRGRVDIFVEQIHDFVTVVEIKATDWNRVAARNRRKLLSAHRRQVLRYVDKYLDDDKVSVCAAIIYPMAPVCASVRREIEKYLNENALQVVWYGTHNKMVAAQKTYGVNGV
jgi:hypothetical protein